MATDSVEPITLFPARGAGGRRVRRADAEANERAILAAATRLFDKYGIDNVTMSAIAGEAKIGKGTLYRAFTNKGELCLALMDDDLRNFQEETLAHLNHHASDTPLPLLADFLHRMVAFMEGHAALMCTAEEHGALHGRSEINQTSLHDWFRLTVLLLLRRAVDAGEVDASRDLDYLADAVLAPLNPRLIRHQLASGLAADVLSEKYVRFVFRGVSG